MPKISLAFLVLFFKYPSEGFKQKSFGLQSSVFQTLCSQRQIWFWSKSWSSEESLIRVYGPCEVGEVGLEGGGG
ncbi:hypothetical protein CXB51_035432 [Gossypium anomalum]|uniref:Uncharacterized protein n=1 Tax=Gossypium anomalum TaxID=47600 RepID=A0A8J5Y503_9ROSI|nr:hypothetical protein CXB51_035432 [Gossypium anomalum]